MATDKTGRPTMTLVIQPTDGPPVEFVGNIWEVMREDANARYLGYATDLKGGPP